VQAACAVHFPSVLLSLSLFRMGVMCFSISARANEEAFIFSVFLSVACFCVCSLR